MVGLFIYIQAVWSIIITFEGVVAKLMAAGSKWSLIQNLGQFTVPLNIRQWEIKNCIPKYPTGEGSEVENVRRKPLQEKNFYKPPHISKFLQNIMSYCIT